MTTNANEKAEQIVLIKRTVLEQALQKATAKRDRLTTNLSETKTYIQELQAAIAAP